MSKDLRHHHTGPALVAIIILVVLLSFGIWLFVTGNISASEQNTLPLAPESVSS